MSWPQVVWGVALIAALLGVSVFYAWRQGRALRELRAAEDLPAEEARYRYRQAYRRLVNCALMLVLAVLLAGTLVFLEGPTQKLADERQALLDAGATEPLPDATPEQQRLINNYALTWILILLVLLAIVVLAALDLWSTRKFGLQQYRQIQADRRAMIESQLARMREEHYRRN